MCGVSEQHTPVPDEGPRECSEIVDVVTKHRLRGRGIDQLTDRGVPRAELTPKVLVGVSISSAGRQRKRCEPIHSLIWQRHDSEPRTRTSGLAAFIGQVSARRGHPTPRGVPCVA